jgi:hypothetical protein
MSARTFSPNEVVTKALKGLVLFHRWVGVGVCAMFTVWFASGAVMVFVAFPSLPQSDRAARAELIDLSRLRIPPDQANRLMGSRQISRLVSVGGTPIYIARGPDGRDSALSGETGQPVGIIGAAQAGKIASLFGVAGAARVEGPVDYDQWVVNPNLNPLRPFYRVRLNDGARTDLYLSARSGEVVQRTRRFERGWNWLGSVVHWIYFVPIRKHAQVWDWGMWSIVLTAVMTTVAGASLGLIRTTKTMRSRRPALSPFRGWLRWHHVMGLTAGIFVLCWIISGWLTNDSGKLFSDGAATATELQAYEGSASSADTGSFSTADLRELGPASSIEFQRVAGHRIAAARGPTESRVGVAAPTGAQIYASMPASLLIAAIHRAWPAARLSPVMPLPADAVLAKAEGLQGDAVQVGFRGSAPRRVYIDALSGRIVAVLSRSREVYDWVCYAVHTYNFPGLSSRPVLRVVVLLVPLTLGFCFSITGVVIGIRRLRQRCDEPRSATRASRSGRIATRFRAAAAKNG